MPTQLSDVTRRKLRVARQAFRLGESLARSSISDADRVAAVVHLDFAIETTLRALLHDRRHPKARADRFRDLLDAVATVMRNEGHGNDVPVRGGIEQARGVRNAAQHEARIPAPDELLEALVHTRDALLSIVGACWGADFLQDDIESLRSHHLIGYLKNALRSVEADDLAGAMGWIRVGFDYAFETGGENIVGRTVDVEALLVRDRNRHRDDPDPFGRGAAAAIALRRLQVLGRLSAFNMSVPEYLGWRGRLAEAPTLNINGDLIRYSNEKNDWTPSEVKAALAYVVDTALNMERVVPDLEPGGFVRGGLDKL